MEERTADGYVRNSGAKRAGFIALDGSGGLVVVISAGVSQPADFGSAMQVRLYNEAGEVIAESAT